MTPDNRISQTTLAATGHRQTPKNEFGEVLVKTSSVALDAGVAVLGSFTSAPVMTAAVSGIRTALGVASTQASAGASGSVGPGPGSTLGGSPLSQAQESYNLQSQLGAESFQLNSMYLDLQRQMQRESREFTTLSNIMKVRHDTAKAAINNVR